jgi:hypothetical protein
MPSMLRLFFTVLCFITAITAHSQEPIIKITAKDSSGYQIQSGVVLKERYFDFGERPGFIEFNSDFEIRDDFSLSFCINPKNKEGFQTIVMKGEGCPDGNPAFNGFTFLIALTQDMTLMGVIFSGEERSLSESLTFHTQQKVALDFWQCVYITFNFKQKEWKLFIDGSEVQISQSFQNSSNGFQQIAKSKNATWKIGVRENYCDNVHKYEDYFLGAIKDISVYDYKRSATQIQNEFQFELNRNLLILGALLLTMLIGFLLILILQYLKRNQFGIPRKWLTAGIITILFFFIFKSEIKPNNTAFFGGDTWEYQSMAVNYYLGFGIQKFGGLATFDQYRFDRLDHTIIDRFNKGAGFDNVYRTPGYPFILGMLYKIVGPHPLLAKYFQLLLLCLIGGTLPLMSMALYNRRGFYIGLFGGVLLLHQYAVTANEILVESVFAFSIYLICWCWILLWKKKSRMSAVCLGVFTGISLLIKGSIIFLPFLMALWFCFFYYKTKEARILKLGAIAFVFTFLAILPWSIYASNKANETVFLSTQTKYILMDGNNELSIDGDWHPQWRDGNNEEFLYGKKDFENKGALYSVFLFYLKRPDLIVSNYIGKLNRAFSELVFHQILFCSLLFLFLQKGLSRMNFDRIFLIILFILSFGLSVIGRFAELSYVFTTMGLILAIYKIGKEIMCKNQSAILWLLYINFFILSVLTYGNRRFVEVIDFVYILLALHSLIEAIDVLVVRRSTKKN